jgi:hypothetical protein
MTLLLTAGMLGLLAAGWVVHPILSRRWVSLGDAVPASVMDREARKRVALAALKDVEYDRAAGKLDDADYEEMRGKLEGEALAALRAAEPTPGRASDRKHTCGFVNPAGSRFCAGCGKRLP